MTQVAVMSSVAAREADTASPGIPSSVEPLGTLFVGAALIYLGIYALEGAIRYGLYLLGKDNLILARDALIIGPLVLLFVAQAMRLRVHPAFWVAGTIFGFHGLVLMGTIGSAMGVIYGVKVLMNLLFGFFAASSLVRPSDKVLRVFVLIWFITLLGACVDKAGVTFPWTGIKTVVGDLDVDVSKDWQIEDPLSRRVAGFTRSSIAIAAMMPPLAIVMMTRVRGLLLRFVIATVSVISVALTTQKGALFAFLPISAILCLKPPSQLGWIKALCLIFVVLSAALPLTTWNLHISHGTGVFSTESLYLRIADTWPDAIEWICRHQMSLFGVGLGGIGGPQRVYAPDSFNPADNIVILLYAFFGIFAALYVAIICFAVLRTTDESHQGAVPAIAIIAFAFGYGTVLSILENQVMTLFLGAAFGMLCAATLQTNPLKMQLSRTPVVRIRNAANSHYFT
ncbi:MAG: hypothetical protein EPO08_18640 [Rhodospirillaceae bacterium]|nr:MAG: hypothetical protein EPO08_18640 [Rhodospirillaceae bacterium]